MQTFMIINPADNVGVALKPLGSGTSISIGDKTITLTEDIPQGHKFAITSIPCNHPIIKYGSPIGNSIQLIEPGSWVHTHNLKTGLGDLLAYQYHKVNTSIPSTPERFFQGYCRPDGKTGIRNEIWIIPTVGCVNNIASAIERLSKPFISGTIDGIAAFPHPYGCSQMDQDQEYTRTILADLINHPNAGGVLVLGLGCENSNITELKKYIGQYDEKRVKFLVCQESDDEIQDGLNQIEELSHYVSTFQREPVNCRELIIGMKCGGSDGLSGITANPMTGAFSDMLISKGGTTILTEVPEMFGAETLLMNRCKNQEIFKKTVTLINDFKQYFTDHNQTIYENPSPGNKKGGISTLEDKSLGCVQKSGTAEITDVLSYGQTVRTKGLNLLSAPGNDLVASTALAASGAHMVLFTTGRGTPFASPVPTVKISTNTSLSEKKQNWIDFNCGVLVEGTDMETLTNEFFDFVIAVASGKQIKSELAGFHDMAIFKQGVTL